jgi:hypothetical protein
MEMAGTAASAAGMEPEARSGRQPVMRSLPPLALCLALLLLAGCAAAGGASPSPSPSPTMVPGPSAGAVLDVGDLRLLLIDRLGPRWYCDPDQYPIAHGDERSNAVDAFPRMQQEQVVFDAVLRRLGLDPSTDFTTDLKVSIYRLWKVAISIPLDPIGGGAYRFDYSALPVGGATTGIRTTGTIDAEGAITVESRTPTGAPTCPICLARGTRIDTPRGPVAVEDLALGDPIWTLDAAGRRIAASVIALGSTVAPADHHVIRLTLADGRSVTASPGHPLADGRLLGTLRVGDPVDGSRVVGLESLAYAGGETFDLVASGPTGIYLSDGIPLGTTLR